MEFSIDGAPPTPDEISWERAAIAVQIADTRRRDLIVTMLLILITALVAATVVYWTRQNFRDAAIAAAAFPILGVILMKSGIITAAGFRSAALKMIELNHQLVALNFISEDSQDDIEVLKEKYLQVRTYCDQVSRQGRTLVNAELALFWELDAGTIGNKERRRDFVERAGETVIR
jgi:hypothetical protein